MSLITYPMATNSSSFQEQRRHQSNAGHWFVEDDPIWKLDKNVNINVAAVLAVLHTDLHHGFKATLAHYATTMSSSHAANMARDILSLLRVMNSSTLDVSTLTRFRATLSRAHEYRLGAPAGFLIKWNALGYPGIDNDVVDLLGSWTLKGNFKGDKVKRLDPTQGPFTDNELLAFNEGAVRAFEQGLVSVSDLAISLLESNTGRRPIQITHIKLCDFEAKGRNKKGEAIRLIRIPRAKQPGAGFRESFKVFAITEELWLVIYAQEMECVKRVEECLGYKLDKKARLALPLLPDLKAFQALHVSGSAISELLQTDQLHLTSKTITAVLRNVAKLAGCRSERTGEVLNIFATRFRYTVGTRAAREGLGPMIIAELLDHTDTQQVDVYTKNVPEHAAILDEKLSALLAPYARAFQGSIIKCEEDAKRGNDLCSRIRYHEEGAGVCGCDNSCGANVPIPCYTCFHFQALLDGPHERVLRELYSERQRILDLTGDEFVAGANDRTIHAVEQLIQRCREAHNEASPKEDDKLAPNADQNDNPTDLNHTQKKER